MQYKKEIKYKNLLMDFDFLPEFKDTSEITGYKDIIGQGRAIEAIDFGLSIDKKGYNIYISGEMGTGKRSYILDKLKKDAKNQKSPKDWCYVYNFNDPYKPKALWLKSGDAYKFKEDIEEVINLLFKEIPKSFSDYVYEKERNDIIDGYKKQISKFINILSEEAGKYNFKVKNTSDGFAFIPMLNDKEMSEQEYDDLDEYEKDKMNSKVSDLKLVALEVIKNTKEIKKQMAEELKELDNKVTLSIIDDHIEKIKENYGYSSDIIDYLNDFEEDILDKIDAFSEYDEEEKDSEEIDENFFKRYSVNVLVSSKDLEGVPVIYEEQPEYSSLIGNVEYENKQGNLVTDFTMIKPGSLHRANGGYLVIEAEALVKSYAGWIALKRSLKTGKISIQSLQSLKSQYDIISLTNLEPDEIPLDVKVVLLGSSYLYYLLYDNDEYFREFFKVKAEFDETIKVSTSTSLKILGFISNYCSDNNYPPITRDGVKEILKYSCREVDSRLYFTARMEKVVDLIDEASILALKREEKKITRKDIKETLNNINKRFGIYKEKTLEKYKEGKYILNIKGYKVGEINGLSVIDVGDFRFGKPNKITAATYVCKGTIVNIEREADMSGNIHNKGVLILSGYFKETFGRERPVSFGASLCFEQLYGGVDGDSASVAELVCLISSLSDVPINQGIAITGSINQKGVVQPVGGVNEKIEGFFDVCKSFGLDGNQGVVLPSRNVEDLILNDDVIDAVRKGLFHIYPVDNIEECFEIVSSKDYLGKMRGSAYDSVKEKVFEKLNSYSEHFN